MNFRLRSFRENPKLPRRLVSGFVSGKEFIVPAKLIFRVSALLLILPALWANAGGPSITTCYATLTIHSHFWMNNFYPPKPFFETRNISDLGELPETQKSTKSGVMIPYKNILISYTHVDAKAAENHLANLHISKGNADKVGEKFLSLLNGNAPVATIILLGCESRTLKLPSPTMVARPSQPAVKDAATEPGKPVERGL